MVTGIAGGGDGRGGAPDDLPAAGWYEDPLDLNRLRYWNGASWTEQVHIREGQRAAEAETANRSTSVEASVVRPDEAERRAQARSRVGAAERIEPAQREEPVHQVEPAPGVEPAPHGEAARRGEAAPHGEATRRVEAARRGEAAQRGEATRRGEAAPHGEAARRVEPVQRGEVAGPGEALLQDEAAHKGEAVRRGEVDRRAEVRPGAMRRAVDVTRQQARPGEAGRIGGAAQRDDQAGETGRMPGQLSWAGPGLPRQAASEVSSGPSSGRSSSLPSEEALVAWETGAGSAYPTADLDPAGRRSARRRSAATDGHSSGAPWGSSRGLAWGWSRSWSEGTPTDLVPSWLQGWSRRATAVASVTVLLVTSVVAWGAFRLTADDAPSVAPKPTAQSLPSCTDANRPTAVPDELKVAAPRNAPAITPTAATAYVESFWRLRQLALHTCDLAGLRMLEAGSALHGDWVRSGCRCLTQPLNAPISDLRVFVPRRTSLPAWFGAEVVSNATDGRMVVNVMVFTRNSARTHWRLALVTEWPAQLGRVSTAYEPQVGRGRYLAHPGTDKAAAARSAATELADFWQQARNTGTVPSTRFGSTSWTTDVPERLAAHPQDTVQDNGLTGHFTYTFRPQTRVYHLTVEGGDLACTALAVQSRYTAGPGAVPRQGPDLRPWGRSVSPGTYQAIATSSYAQTCFLLPNNPDQPVHVLGGDPVTEALAAGIR